MKTPITEYSWVKVNNQASQYDGMTVWVGQIVGTVAYVVTDINKLKDFRKMSILSLEALPTAT